MLTHASNFIRQLQPGFCTGHTQFPVLYSPFYIVGVFSLDVTFA